MVEFPGQSERGEHGVSAGQRDPSRAGQCPVGVDAQQRVAQRVLGVLAPAARAAARERVRTHDARAARQKQLQYLELVAVCGQHHRRHVRRVVAALRVRRLGALVRRPFDAQHLAADARMVDQQLDDAVDALADRVQQRVADVHAFLPQQQLHDLDVLIVHGDLHNPNHVAAVQMSSRFVSMQWRIPRGTLLTKLFYPFDYNIPKQFNF